METKKLVMIIIVVDPEDEIDRQRLPVYGERLDGRRNLAVSPRTKMTPYVGWTPMVRKVCTLRGRLRVLEGF